MTVVSDVKTTIAGLKSAQASLETFSLVQIMNKQSNYIKMLPNKRKPSLIVLNQDFNKYKMKSPNIDNSVTTGWLYANRFYF